MKFVEEVRQGRAEMRTTDINLADLDEVRTIGNVRVGDYYVIDAWLLPVVEAVRRGKMIFVKAVNKDAPQEYRYRYGNHRVSTPVARAIPGVQVFRRVAR
jgi:hypothetical protein